MHSMLKYSITTKPEERDCHVEGSEWMGLQADYGLKISARELKAALKRIQPNRDPRTV